MMVPDVPAAVAAAALKADAHAHLIDVRTEPEWQGVGVPLTGTARPVHFVSWQTAPSMQHNPRFVEQLDAAGAAKTDALYFICRSGARSAAAAAAAQAAGYEQVFNVMEGFEGGRAGPGWAAQGLPAGDFAG